MRRGDPLYTALVYALVGGVTLLVIAFVRVVVPPIYGWIIKYPLWKRRLVFWPVMLAIIGAIYVAFRGG